MRFNFIIFSLKLFMKQLIIGAIIHIHLFFIHKIRRRTCERGVEDKDNLLVDMFSKW